MSLRELDLYMLLGELEWKAFKELDDVADYIWKSPTLLTHEKTLEQHKLATYFPDVDVKAGIRERYQAKKLNETFPRLIAVGNLFSAMSVFENYVLLLLNALQEHNAAVPKHESSQGIAALLKAMKAHGAEPHEAKYYEQVCAAISIRNCLMHAKGALAAFRHADALKTQIHQHRFLCAEDRKRRADRENFLNNDLVALEETELGDRLVITNDYSHLACCYLSKYFCALCGTLNPVFALRPMTFEIDPRDLALNLHTKVR